MELNIGDAPLAEILEDPTDLLLIKPLEARQQLERIATEAHVQNPGDWRVPVRAVLDAVFVREPPEGPKPKRKYRTKTRYCLCGCGEIIRPLMRRGPVPKYLNDTHARRHQRRVVAAKKKGKKL